ncbi:ferredoxin reductase [Microbacteriaceae bacterium K1510]|nr:ferredoxin reductase [Microbacteriaceae bacterium K1510]
MTATEAPAAPRLRWMTATARAIVDETPRVRSLVLDVPDWPGHQAGQHVDVRLTADDGYQAQRSYSIASAPGADLMLTIERLDDGEVSSYLAGDLRAGDQFELRGPIGGYFVWTPALDGPLFLVAGGSGVVPLMAMLRTRALAVVKVPTVLLYSSRSAADIIYRAELDRLAAADGTLKVVHTLTRERPDGWTGYTRRIDRAMLEEVGFLPALRPRIFVCGPTSMVESAASTLRALGHAANLIKTERFGPSGR